MTIKRRDFQKAASLLHEFQLKLPEDAECAELRDALNLALLHMQRYYRRLRAKHTAGGGDKNGTGSSQLLTQSLRGLSPFTPFKDAPDKFLWKWVNLEGRTKLTNTLPADLNKELSSLPQIILAAKQGDNNMLMHHLDSDPDCVFEVDGLGRNALMYAVNFGHLDTVQVLLENGIDVNATASDGSTAVHRACHNGQHEALQILIHYDAKLDAEDMAGRSPVHWACAHSSRDCLKMLVDNGASPSARDLEGLTPTMWACRMDNIDHLEVLSAAGENDVAETDHSGRTWQHWSVRRTEPLECLKTLLTEESADIRDNEGLTVMHYAAETGALSAVKIVLEIAGQAVINQRDAHNRTPLILATIGGHGEIVNYLLTEGADLACVDESGATAWDYAGNRQLHYCMLILASYIRQRARDESDEPPETPGDTLETPGGTLGLGHLQIQGEDNPVLYGHRPIPPPHPPTEPITPRTPRTPRPMTPATPRGTYTQRGQHYGAQSPTNPPRPPTATPGGHGGVKRSPSTPEDTDDQVNAFFQKNTKKPNSPSNKRIKSEQSPDREALMSVMSVESPEQTARGQSSGTRSYTPGSDADMANDYADPGDDDNSRVSIDAMDVSDFDADAEDALDGPVDAGKAAEEEQYPSPSPRPPPQPSPRTSPPAQPFSYAPPARKQNKRANKPRYNQQPPPPPMPNDVGNYDDDLEPDDFEPGDQMNGDGGRDPSPPRQYSAGPPEGRMIPPAHLTPLSPSQPAPATPKKKKKKKKRGEDTRSYVAPIPAPFHPGQPPPPAPSPRERSPPQGAGRSGSLDRGTGLNNALHGQPRPNSGAMKPTPRKRATSLGPEHEQRSRRHDDQSDDDDDEYRPRLSRKQQAPPVRGDGGPLKGRLSGGHGNGAPPAQNGPMRKRPPSGSRREPSPSPRDQQPPSPRDQHPPSPRSRRPPSGSLGAVTTSNNSPPPWTNKKVANGRLPPQHR